MASQIDYVSDWAARLRSRLYTQFRDATSWQAWCNNVIGPQAQDLEDAAQTLLTLLSIEDSSGVQLDTIGRIVGQPRNGVDDPTYQLYLSARVLANKSTGTVDELFTILRAIVGQDASITYAGGLAKQFAMKITKAITRGQALVSASFIHDAEEAGTRGILEWIESAPALMFQFDGTASPTGLGFDVGFFAGAKVA